MTDYILKAYDSNNNVFWGQVGNGDIDHQYWGAPEDMTMERPAYKIDAQHPGSDLAGESAAALASASIIFRATNINYSNLLLSKAKGLYNFAETYPGKYSDSIPDAAKFYPSYSYRDELAWGAIWLHKALVAAGQNTGDYLHKAKSYYTVPGQTWTQSWDDKSYGTAILLAQETNEISYRNQVEKWLNTWSDKQRKDPPRYTPGGLAWLDKWGSLRYAANTAFLAGVYADTVNDPNDRYSKFTTSQIDYILGDNPRNFSYMVGFGDNSAKNPHHAAASGTNDINDPNNNLHVIYGALVGGPYEPDDYAYQDLRTDYVANEVALDYNAAFTGVLARMYQQFGGEPSTKSIALKAHNGKYVSADLNDGGKLIANRERLDEWESFELIEVGDKIGMKAANGKYVSADLSDGGKLVANRERLDKWESFELIEVGDKIGMKATNGKYVSADLNDGVKLVANRERLDEWESFELIKV